ncbi:hypothetical protein FQN51_006062 [Onygenales sp. PD_10]|nr:hypothetical protein FQN51_006062 [Onygenales sp. PD_10]
MQARQSAAASQVSDPGDAALQQEIIPCQVDQATFDGYKQVFRMEAMLDPEGYVKLRRARIHELEETIDMLETATPPQPIRLSGLQSTLEWVRKSMPPGPIYPPSEPAGLDPIIYYRLACLLASLETPIPFVEANKTNINAVIDAYRHGELKFHPNRVTFWWNGTLVEDLSYEEEGNFDYKEAIARWTETYGEGRLWKERISPPRKQL